MLLIAYFELQRPEGTVIMFVKEFYYYVISCTIKMEFIINSYKTYEDEMWTLRLVPNFITSGILISNKRDICQ